MRFEPRLNNVVVPIIHTRRTADGYVAEGSLGTGFPLKDKVNKLFIVTAAHVLRASAKGESVPCALLFTSELAPKVFPLSKGRFDDATDLACCPIEVDPRSGVEVVPFGITADNTEQTRTVFVHEFSYTRSSRGVQGLELSFFPITHKGNILGHIAGASVEHAKEPIGIYWLSEEMFEGASGAPVLRDPDFAVCGVVLGSQTELDAAGYMAGDQGIKRAFGVAVQAEVVKLALGRMGLVPDYVK